MNIEELKTILHQNIDNSDDMELLRKLKSLFEQPNVKQFPWKALEDYDQYLIDKYNNE